MTMILVAGPWRVFRPPAVFFHPAFCFSVTFVLSTMAAG
jgi:hypothetical protein